MHRRHRHPCEQPDSPNAELPSVNVGAVHNISAPPLGKTGNSGKFVPNSCRDQHLGCAHLSAVVESEREAIVGSSGRPQHSGLHDASTVRSSLGAPLFQKIERVHALLTTEPGSCGCGRIPGCAPVDHHDTATCTDRKSTRLNSSHEAI